ncbi:MAG: asparagine synthase-related protein [Planctomycetota bacterium]
MSEICGAIRLSRDGPPIDTSTLAAMCGVDSIRDDGGVYAGNDGRAAMGCFSETEPGRADASHPAVSSADGKVIALVDGIITNIPDISERLGSKALSSAAPAQVMAELFAGHGVEGFGYPEGEYAGVVIEKEAGRIFLVRDRLGLKPLYYVIKAGVCYFSTRIRPLLRVVPESRAINPRGVYHFLTFCAPPPPYTAFKDICKVALGHYVLIDEKCVPVSVNYWGPWMLRKTVEADEGELVEELRRRLNQAIARRLENKRIGTFLSGGMDSSTITALVAKVIDHPLHTFCLGMDESWGKIQRDFDEAAYARAVAEKVGTEHHELRVGSDEYFTGLVEALARMEEPIVTSEMGLTNLVSRAAAAEGIEIIFNGEGSDTIMYGSSLYGDIARLLGGKWSKIRRLPRPLLVFGRWLQRVTSREHEESWRPFSAKWNLYNLSRGIELYCGKAFTMPEAFKRQFFTPAFLESVAGEDSYSLVSPYLDKIRGSCADGELVDEMMLMDFPFWLGELYNVENEKIYGSYGMEPRAPFYDMSILELSLQSPVRFKIRPDKVTKYLLRKAVEDVLPEEVINRPKVGFTTPMVGWLNRKIAGAVTEALNSSEIRKLDIFDLARIQYLCELHREGRIDLTWHLLSLYILTKWYDMWVTGTNRQS